MKVQIQELGFRLRDDTETIKYTLQAEQFFKDHDLLYVIESREDGEILRFHEDNSVVDLVQVTSLEIMNLYINKYDMTFKFSDKICVIEFV